MNSEKYFLKLARSAAVAKATPKRKRLVGTGLKVVDQEKTKKPLSARKQTERELLNSSNEWKNIFKKHMMSNIILKNNCFEWQKSRDQNGYGETSFKHVTLSAHRVTFLLFKGPIPLNHEVCHTCDNPPCINPDHLFSGTDLENVRDKVNKGRHIFGEKVKVSKLTNEQVLEIKMVYKNRTSHRWGAKKLSKKFGVSDTAICYVAHNRNWAHIKVKP